MFFIALRKLTYTNVHAHGINQENIWLGNYTEIDSCVGSHERDAFFVFQFYRSVFFFWCRSIEKVTTIFYETVCLYLVISLINSHCRILKVLVSKTKTIKIDFAVYEVYERIE